MSFTNTIDRAYSATRRDVRRHEDEDCCKECGAWHVPGGFSGIIYSRCTETGCKAKACDECYDDVFSNCAACGDPFCAAHLTEDSRGKLCASCRRIADEGLQLIAQSLERLALDIRERRVLPSRVKELLGEYVEDVERAA